MNKSARIANRQAWIQRLDRFKQANQTVAQFCQTEGVSVPSFYQWRNKLKPKSQTLTTAPAQFLPVELVSAPQAQHAAPQAQHAASQAQPATVLSLDLPGGISLRLEVRSDQEQTS